MIEYLLSAHASNLGYLKKLVKDLTPEQMTAQPVAGVTMNHAAWTIGHMIGAQNFALTSMGAKPVDVPAKWRELYSPGSKPLSEPGANPSKVELMKSLEACYDAVAAAVKAADPAIWKQPFPMENRRTVWPTVGDGVIYLITVHDAAHLGQISAWRRAMGLPGVM